MGFRLATEYAPAGDQPQAIEQLVNGLHSGLPHQVLLGATGTGKTFTIANVIQSWGRPTLLLAHNKTLAAQLYGEMKKLFPDNAVEYFVSYFDYYQPEAYIPSSDTYIEKDSLINDHIDKLRHAATRSLLERNDVIIVASVSCIYGLGSPEAYDNMIIQIEPGQTIRRKDLLARLVELQYQRNDADLHRGCFRARGDVIEVVPAHEAERAIRIELFGDEVEALRAIDPFKGTRLESLEKICLYPASHYVTPREKIDRAVQSIRDELLGRLQEFRDQGLLLEAQRLEQRTSFDLEMIEQMGFCNGIENYSRHLTQRAPGEAPPTLLEYFPGDWLLVIDESHVTVPQVGGMYHGDRSRKEVLVKYGFRLPSALDNRPLTFAEFEAKVCRAIYVSATPAPHELHKAMGVVAEQVIRPTGLLDPVVEVRPAQSQVDDALGEIRGTLARGWRVLVTTLTKRMAQELTDYYREIGLRVKYLHSDVDTLERMQILRELRQGEFDVLVGINLLREGLDLPEVALVCVMDADKEGFLRSGTSLIQTIGRAARNAEGRVILYADHLTAAMSSAMAETDRRRARQVAYNEAHGITPRTIVKAVDSPLAAILDADYLKVPKDDEEAKELPEMVLETVPLTVARLRAEMKQAAAQLDFERAAELRDRVKALEKMLQ
ncbi:MAG: excinuclease ABC subunit UvrB [Deltaproteobacteria bacterium]|nr:excinuclease ABC subunit UvrB [Deltaproteobacteria bacterium]